MWEVSVQTDGGSKEPLARLRAQRNRTEIQAWVRQAALPAGAKRCHSPVSRPVVQHMKMTVVCVPSKSGNQQQLAVVSLVTGFVLCFDVS